MANSFYLWWVIGVLVFSIIYLSIDKIFLKTFNIKSDKVSFESAGLALNRMEKWSTWLTGLQTAAIATMGFLIKENTNKAELIRPGFFALLFFGASIILSTWLLSCLPSIQQRLINSEHPDSKNDIYMMKIFSFVPFRMGRFTGLIHMYFLVGIVFFALFVFKSLTI